MHMADALLSPAVGATFWAGSLGAVAYCAKRLKESMDERMIPLMGVLGAFIFASQMINFTIPGTGSSGLATTTRPKVPLSIAPRTAAASMP